MKRTWPGWILCVLTVALLAYMATVQGPEISASIGGLYLPDAVPLGYGTEAAAALHQAFVSEAAKAQATGLRSASAAYVAMHAGSDLLFPPMLAASLAFAGFAALNSRRNQAGSPLSARIGLGLVLALAFAYLGCDYVENAVADAMFGLPSLSRAFNAQLVPVLRGLTAAKFLTGALALMLIVALWIGRWRAGRKPAGETV
ncbi:hypothetical protein OEG84_21600 [Hoeflea sp. G2-23]|uniref:Uncharacterized protein n=1 Tax=Hoeflea algicola TaxID=2983763 RepID=A0ABT3ZF12_9HYPH|nr:hypothetical protein [Hoeflea algicola]MCY0150228.1 hypothetical protein [Hoeflea algicola]